MTRPDLYRPVAGRFDEFVDDAGLVRAHWQPFLDAWQALGSDEVLRRQAVARRMVMAERSAHASEQHVDRALPQELDAVPYVLSAIEWHRMERAMAQRSVLLDAVVSDLYGERRLVSNGVIPSSLLFSNAAYQVAVTDGRQWLGAGKLATTAAELVRTAAGEFQVMRDITDVATGCGFTSLYRSVMARVFPTSSRDLTVRPLEPWFSSLHRSLSQRAPRGVESPRTVLLAPDADDDDAVEASYLATSLGFHLADARDLVVRNGRVWLQALGGLEPTDVLWRLLAERSCDPLELGPTSAGVAGLMQAVRSGSIAVNNPFGSGLADGQWLHPFLGDACQLLLGEPLLMASVPTFWLGDADQRTQVLTDIEQYVILDATGSSAPRVAAELSEQELNDVHRLLSEQPHRYLAQACPQLGTTPTVVDGVLRPAVSSLRVQAAHTDHGVAVLPGGVGRHISVAGRASDTASVAKDVWIVGWRGGDRSGQRHTAASLPQVDLRSSLPTRSAEALWWLGRNAERAETTTRLARVILARSEVDPDLAQSPWLEPIVAALRAVSGGQPEPSVVRVARAEHLWQEVAASLGSRPGGLADSVHYLVSSARGARGFLSATTWKVLNDLLQERSPLALALGKADPFPVTESLDRTLVELTALAGLGIDSMVRGPAWSFLNIGRALERAWQSVNLFDQVLTVSYPETEPLYGTLLSAAESLVAYRRRYRSDLRVDSVVEMLVHDVTNPRSLIFQLDRLSAGIATLPFNLRSTGQEALVSDVRTTLAASTMPLSARFSAARTSLVRLTADFADGWFTQSFTQELSTTR